MPYWAKFCTFVLQIGYNTIKNQIAIYNVYGSFIRKS